MLSSVSVSSTAEPPEDAAALARLYDGLEAWLSAAPGELGSLAQRYARQIGLSQRVYFSYPDAPPLVQLPLWLGADLPASTIDTLLRSAALAYGSVRITDNLLDEPDTRGDAPLLLLGNVMMWDAMDTLRSLALSDRFWSLARQAWQTSNAAAAAELRMLARRGPYPTSDYVEHAQKVALAEIPLLAVLDLQGRLGAHADDVRALVHTLGKAYGVFNDVTGYRRDLRAGGQTWLLAEVRARLGLCGDQPERSPLEAEMIEAALLREPLLEQFLERARPWHEEARVVARRLALPRLMGLLDARDRRIETLSLEISALRLVSALSPPARGG